MNRAGWWSHLTALLTALIACVGLLSLSTAPAWAAAAQTQTVAASSLALSRRSP